MRYAIIENGIVKNIVRAEANFATQQGWIECPEYDQEGQAISTGFFYSNNKFSKPSRNLEFEWNEIRSQRNSLLNQTDWTQNADAPQAIKDKWLPYRQALRDIPATFADPKDVVWPTKPE